MKKQTLGKVKKRLWSWFSKYIRMKYSDDNGYCKCVTCGMVNHYTSMHAGHFIARAQGNACYFEEDNVHVQCYRCNINLGGNGPEYYPFMVETYGEERVHELRELSKTTRKFTVNDLLEMEAEYKQKVKEQEERILRD